jgi:hypothetical protein
MQKLVLILSLFSSLIAAPVASSVIATPNAGTLIVQKGRADVKVWVNTESHVYHCPGTRWYGKTKQGEFMTQKQAQDSGNRPAYKKYCE